METDNIEKLEKLENQIKVFLNEKKIDSQLNYCLKQTTFHSAIIIAAKAINENKKIHPHQRKNGRKSLDLFSLEIIKIEEELNKAVTFDEIFDLICLIKVDRISKLAFYDTSYRIGCYKNIFPDKIYLHSGTLIGAKRLNLPVKGKNKLDLSELPIIFKTLNMAPYQIEDFLCHCKDKF